jgi:colicin import membrane protein
MASNGLGALTGKAAMDLAKNVPVAVSSASLATRDLLEGAPVVTAPVGALGRYVTNKNEVKRATSGLKRDRDTKRRENKLKESREADKLKHLKRMTNKAAKHKKFTDKVAAKEEKAEKAAKAKQAEQAEPAEQEAEVVLAEEVPVVPEEAGVEAAEEEEKPNPYADNDATGGGRRTKRRTRKKKRRTKKRRPKKRRTKKRRTKKKGAKRLRQKSRSVRKTLSQLRQSLSLSM